MLKTVGFIALSVLCLLAILGCSQTSLVELPMASDRSTSLDGHVLQGYYRLYIDPSGPTVDVVPVRNVEKHFNVKPFINPPNCNDCIKIQPTGPFTDHILPLDITLKNPEPIKGYDIRGILLSDDPEAYLNNPDSYTGLFDNGGAININPFRAFAKSVADRAFGPSESFKEHYDLYLSKFKKVTTIDYAVDASWPSRAKEPYDVQFLDITENLDSYGFYPVIIYVQVHSAGDDVDEVLLDCSSMGFTEDLPLALTGGITWQINMKNTAHAPVGVYKIMAKASTASSDKYLYNYASVTVVQGTPPVSLHDDVQPILDSRCTECHKTPSPPVNLNLTEGNVISNTVNVKAVQSVAAKRVLPEKPQTSYLYAKIVGNYQGIPFLGSGKRMPYDGPPYLTTAQAKTIYDWIFQGALDN